VQDQQVNLVDTELGCALLKSVQGLVVAEVADPDLGLDKDFFARYARVADALADLFLVAVGGRGIDVAVASLQG
jgi:hypothetical protein